MSVCVINIGFISGGEEVLFIQILRIYHEATLLSGFLRSNFFFVVSMHIAAKRRVINNK